MTKTELNKVLKGYAKEDVTIAIDNDSMCVTGTKKGVITINHENGVLEAFSNMGELLTGKIDKDQMIIWLTNQYTVN